MKRIGFILIVCIAGLAACDKNDNFVVFSVENDVQLGQQVKAEILADPKIKILSQTQYPDVYNFLYHIRDGILNSGTVSYKTEFAWEVYVIDDDSTLNAFATPGGYIYVYTGLIKYLDHADDLAGVMGHEMAHADLRHTVRNLQKQYGVQALLAIALGRDPNALAQIAAQVAGQLAGLKFSRDYETEADSHSVDYLSKTEYACNGAAYFFIKLTAAEQGGQPPEFLSTHPNPENRIENINGKAQSLGCKTTLASNTGYDAIKQSLGGSR
jgi:predicted Zn-dependent protease